MKYFENKIKKINDLQCLDCPQFGRSEWDILHHGFNKCFFFLVNYLIHWFILDVLENKGFINIFRQLLSFNILYL